MISGERQKVMQNAVRWPCGVCSKGVGSNSLQCTSCHKWVHKECSRIKGSMSKVAKSFICRGCLNLETIAGRTSIDIGSSAKLQQKMSDLLQNSTDDSMSNVTDCQSLTDEWSSLCSSIMKLAAESLGFFSSNKHQDWFDEQRHDILSLLHEKNNAHDMLLRNQYSASLHQRWKELRNKVQADLCQMVNKWCQKAEEIQHFADTNDTQKFYEVLKTIYGPTQHAVLSMPYTR